MGILSWYKTRSTTCLRHSGTLKLDIWYRVIYLDIFFDMFLVCFWSVFGLFWSLFDTFLSLFIHFWYFSDTFLTLFWLFLIHFQSFFTHFHPIISLFLPLDSLCNCPCYTITSIFTFPSHHQPPHPLFFPLFPPTFPRFFHPQRTNHNPRSTAKYIEFTSVPIGG